MTSPSLCQQYHIDICYREDKEGSSAFFDHYAIQHSTGRPTRAVGVTNGGRRLREAIQKQTFSLPHSSIEQNSWRQTPPLLNVDQYLADDAPGLLFLPGRFPGPESVGQSLRRSNEERMLKAAFLRGCPILAVCDGALVIWEMQGGTTTSVFQHSYGRMPSITSTGKIGYNITMHRLKIKKGSLLEAAMTEKPPNARI